MTSRGKLACSYPICDVRNNRKCAPGARHQPLVKHHRSATAQPDRPAARAAALPTPSARCPCGSIRARRRARCGDSGQRPWLAEKCFRSEDTLTKASRRAARQARRAKLVGRRWAYPCISRSEAAHSLVLWAEGLSTGGRGCSGIPGSSAGCLPLVTMDRGQTEKCSIVAAGQPLIEVSVFHGCWGKAMSFHHFKHKCADQDFPASVDRPILLCLNRSTPRFNLMLSGLELL